MNKKIYKNFSEVLKKLDPEVLSAMYNAIAIGVLATTVRSNSFKKVEDISEEQKRKEHIREMDSKIRENRRLNRRVMSRSGSAVQDSYISWMTQSDMDSIMDAYQEYKELGI